MRQAVVIIHGIGEQTPMSTLRGFVDTLVKYEAAEKIKKGEIKAYEKNYWSKPDEMSESFELRRIVLAGKGERPTTDFFEYYWASSMQDTGINHVLPWFRTLLFKWPWHVPRRLILVWMLSWLLTIGIVIGFLVFFSDGGELPAINNNTSSKKGGGIDLGFGNVISYSKLFSFMITGLLILMQRTLISYVGDAARYLTPSPTNITQRQNIRKNGINLLRKLHELDETGQPKYSRIVMVGHSLGSVIAYDIISYLWADYNKKYGEGKVVDAKIFDDLKAAADLLETAIQEEKEEEEIERLRTAFRKQQVKLKQALRAADNPWLVTDLVTLGSPLSHGAFLLSRNKEDFESRKEDRELLTCPPVLEKEKYYYFDYSDKRYYLHHAAAFAPTVWTNIYYPGDFIGGPISGVLGHGIKDIKVVYGGAMNRFTSYFSPISHLQYWKDKADWEKMDDYKTKDAIKVLFDAVDLNNLRQHPDSPSR